jgi:hypothetical protein
VIPANPAIQIDDQVRIFERVTDETFFHYVTGITSAYDAETGKGEYTLRPTGWASGSGRLGGPGRPAGPPDPGVPERYRAGRVGEPMPTELQRRQDTWPDTGRTTAGWPASRPPVTPTGSGVVEFEDPIEFGVLFIEEPRVHYGSYCNADDLRNAADLLPNDPLPLPTMSGSVTEWDQDENDHYVGCWVAVSVYHPTLLIDSLAVTHHFNFHGIALKVVGHDPTD